MLAITTAVPGDYQTKTSGLMGNFNNDPNDDFIPRGETNALPANINDSQIFEYGKTCEHQLLESNKTKHKMGLNVSKPACLWGLRTKMCRPACVSAPSDQHLCNLIIGKFYI